MKKSTTFITLMCCLLFYQYPTKASDTFFTNDNSTLSETEIALTDCNESNIAYWDLDACLSNANNDGTKFDYSEFTAITNTPSGFSSVSASILDHDGEHSCTAGESGAAICSSIRDNCSWQDNSDDAFRFSVTVSPIDGEVINLTSLSFYEAAPLTFLHLSGNSGDNDPPSRYGVRVLKNGQEIYQNIDNNTTPSWSFEQFDFSNDSDFEVS